MKEEKLKVISEVNKRFDEISNYLDRLEEIEDKETKENNSEADYSLAVTSTRGTLEILRGYFDWYCFTVDERD